MATDQRQEAAQQLASSASNFTVLEITLNEIISLEPSIGYLLEVARNVKPNPGPFAMGLVFFIAAVDRILPRELRHWRPLVIQALHEAAGVASSAECREAKRGGGA